MLQNEAMPRASLRNASQKGGKDVGRIEEMSEAPRAGGPVRVGLCRDSAPVNSTL